MIGIDDKNLEKLYRLYENILIQARDELPEIPCNTTKRKGKIAKSQAHNLYERLKKYKDAVLLNHLMSPLQIIEQKEI